MKPTDLDDWSIEDKAEYSWKLLASPRGYLLMNEALMVAASSARSLGKISDAEDLDSICEALFPLSHEETRLVEIPLDQLTKSEDKDE